MLARELRPQLEALISANDAPEGEVYSPDAAASSRRAIKNRALQMVASLEEPSVTQECLRRFRAAGNMTDQIAALGALVDLAVPERQVGAGSWHIHWAGAAIAAELPVLQVLQLS